MMSKILPAYAVTTALSAGLIILYLTITDWHESRSSVVTKLMAPQAAKGVVSPSVQMMRNITNLSEWTTIETNNRAGCEPKMNVVFLKTHKTASTTIANIMFRFGERRSLTFALPVKGHTINLHSLVPSPTGIYNILTNHATFQPQAFKETMPLDTFYVTIIRDPKTQFESHYNSYSCSTSQYIGVPMEQFIRNPQRYIIKKTKRGGRQRCVLPIRNPQLFDLGLTSVNRDGQYPSTSELDASVDRWMGVLDKSFHLVMIAEYFYESLVALKELMCWDIDDVVFFDYNRRQTRLEEDKLASLNDLITKWNSGDVKLYQHFNRSFWRKLELIGLDNVSREKAAIHKRKSELVDRCLDTKAAQTGRVIDIILKHEMENDPLCKRMAIPPPTYTDILRSIMKRKV